MRLSVCSGIIGIIYERANEYRVLAKDSTTKSQIVKESATLEYREVLGTSLLMYVFEYVLGERVMIYDISLRIR